MAYFERRVEAGRVTEIYRYQRPNRKKEKQIREPKTKPTPQRMAAINEMMAEQKLRWLINANFMANDFYLTLTYKKAQRPDPQEAKDHLRKFMRDVRRIFKKQGKVCKYITVTEYKKNAIHHHIVLSACDMGALNALWGKAESHGHIHMTPLDNTGQYAELAHYLIKETAKTFREKTGASLKRWNESRNLIHPEPKVKKISAKKFRETPEADPGTYLEPDSLVRQCWCQDIPFVGGLEYVRYTMIKPLGWKEALQQEKVHEAPAARKKRPPKGRGKNAK